MGKALGIVNRVISTHLIKKAGHKKIDCKSRISHSNTVLQFCTQSRCGPINLHFHILFIDGVFQRKENDGPHFRVKAPSTSELNSLVVKGSTKKNASSNKQESSADCHKAQTWAERLKRVFKSAASELMSQCVVDVVVRSKLSQP